MVGLGRFPKHEPDYQEFYCTQVSLAKERLSHYPQVNKLFDNFRNAENLKYKQNRNKIFLTCIQRIETIDPTFFLEAEKNKEDKDPIKVLIDHDGYPHAIELLEKSLTTFDISKWHNKQYNSFKNRITDLSYSESDSAYEEIITAFRLGSKIGFDKVKYESKIPSGKNPDIQVSLNGKEIYLELTAINQSRTDEKIQSILDEVAKYLFNKIESQSVFHFELWLDTTKLVTNNDGIDEEPSKNFLFTWIDKLLLNELVGCDGILYLSDYRDHSGIMEFAKNTIMEYPYHRQNMRELLDNNKIIQNWASKVTIFDAVNSPFVTIACNSNYLNSSVTTHEDAMHSTHEELVESGKFSDIETGRLQEESFFKQILRKISYKIKVEQYKHGFPIIFLIKGGLWSNSYETDDEDFLKIEIIVRNSLNLYPYISGVLLYYSEYTHGKFIHNPNADPKIRISTSELSSLFS